MAPYIAIIWDETDIALSSRARALRHAILLHLSHWSTALDAPGMFIAFQPPSIHDLYRLYPLSRGRGAVLGRLFSRTYAESRAISTSTPGEVMFNDVTTSRVLADRGDTLRDDYWGGYIAFLNDAPSGKRWVLRDPTGQIPCQLAHVDGVSAYFLRLSDFDLARKSRFHINAKYFLGKAVLGNNFSVDTGYEEVSTVLPGERVEHSPSGVKRDFYWNAVQLASRNERIDLSEAEHLTKCTVRASVHAWASCFDSLALQLSGGLDSSIIAALLATAPNRPKVLAINGHLNLETSDERKFAREVSQLHGFELLEIRVADPGRLDLRPRAERTVTPTSVDTGISGWSDVCRLLTSRGFFAQFRGDGGDELFYKSGALPDAVDFAYYHGIQPALWSIAMNDAILGRTSVWETLRKAVVYGLFRRPCGPHEWFAVQRRVERSIFTPEARREALSRQDAWHPLYRGVADCAPAKLFQSYGLLRYTMRIYTPPPTSLPPIFLQPLVSQPHMEFSLKTPLHVLRAGGRDRARARAAFSDGVPPNILSRRYKGLYTTPTQRWVSEIINEVREMLLDGYLARERIVDRTALERVLAKGAASDLVVSGVIKSCLDCEVWVRDALAFHQPSEAPSDMQLLDERSH